MKPAFKKPPKHVSERMKKIKSSNTKLEEAMKVTLKSMKLKYQEQPRIKGFACRPDFRIKGTNVLIFCDSSFWHGRNQNELSGVAFKRNKKFWVQKLKYNKAKDLKYSRMLRKVGWSVQRFWDADILRNPNKIKSRLKRVVHVG